MASAKRYVVLSCYCSFTFPQPCFWTVACLGSMQVSSLLYSRASADDSLTLEGGGLDWSGRTIQGISGVSRILTITSNNLRCRIGLRLFQPILLSMYSWCFHFDYHKWRKFWYPHIHDNRRNRDPGARFLFYSRCGIFPRTP